MADGFCALYPETLMILPRSIQGRACASAPGMSCGVGRGDRAMQRRTPTAEGRAIYGKRTANGETVSGVIKEVLGFRRLHLCGFARNLGRMEWCVWWGWCGI